MSAMQLATNKRLRWPADNVTFSGGNACELTKFLLPLVANRSLPVRRSSNGVLLQIDDGPGYTLALVTSEIKGCQGNISRNEQTAERASAYGLFDPPFALSLFNFHAPLVGGHGPTGIELVDRKSTRLNSSHSQISYAVFCLKKKKNHDLQAADRSDVRASSGRVRAAMYVQCIATLVCRRAAPSQPLPQDHAFWAPARRARCW